MQKDRIEKFITSFHIYMYTAVVVPGNTRVDAASECRVILQIAASCVCDEK